MDDGIVRIKLEEDTGGGTTPPPPGAAPPGGAPAPPPPPPAAAPGRDWVRDLVDGIAGANRHVLIEGQSGSGKSLLTKHLAFERMNQGEDVYVVDQHNPEAWGGAKGVFQGARAGTEAADFMREVLASRKAEATEAKLRGELPDFKPMTIVLSDFARLMKDTPALAEEFRTLMTEARKFRVSLVADTTSLTAAATGAKGILDIRQNFGQRVKLEAPTAEDPTRKARIGGEKHEVPVLPDYAERRDLGLVKPDAEPPPDPLGPEAAARRQMEKERYREQVEQARLAVDPAYREQKEAEEEEARKRDADRAEKQIRDEMHRTERAREREQERIRREQEKARREEEQQKKEGGLFGALKGARGFVGGSMGRVAGASLDVMSATGSGATGVAMAVPAAGLALAASEAVRGAVKGAISTAGSVLTSAARTGEDPGETVHNLSSAVSSLGDKIPVIGIALNVVGEAGKILGSLMQEFKRTAERYAEYNPMIAQQLAMNEVRQVLNDMRRAQAAGPELARQMREQAELQQKFEDIKMQIWMKVLPILTAIMQRLGRLLGIAEDQANEAQLAAFDPTNIIMGEPGAAQILVPQE